jgi:probable phosphoglycerate mutase
MRSQEAGPDEGPAFAVPELPDDVELWVVRHGETEWSASGRHTSRTDLPLTAAGERQARAIGTMLRDLQPALVLCSPRLRATETARLAGLRVDETTEELAEWDYGDYEGKTTAEIREEDPTWSLWTHGTPGGEPRQEVAARADRVLSRAAGVLPAGLDRPAVQRRSESAARHRSAIAARGTIRSAGHRPVEPPEPCRLGRLAHV